MDLDVIWPPAAAVWQILVEEAGAHPDDFPMFEFAWPDCREYRFMGKLGFGGKVWADPGGEVRVSCYAEDETADRHDIIERTNGRLAELAAC